MTALRRLVDHYVLRKPHTPRHAKPRPVASSKGDDLIPFDSPAVYRHPYNSPKDAA
ncbi:hypothetical protein ACQP2T_63790 (plasmid) [Nonomuraea sp. CA-143628]|uniref:hypothetical protein n=1 Tax=Nonomuraea sp. CA-143628 TaxID=3239997 RepID=UPI003D8B93C1